MAAVSYVGPHPIRDAGLAGAFWEDRLVASSRGMVVRCEPSSAGHGQVPNLLTGPSWGSKHHLICDEGGVPLAVQLTGANRKDSKQALALVDAIPPLHGPHRRPRQRPDRIRGDRGYDAEAISRVCATVASCRCQHGDAPRTAVAARRTLFTNELLSPLSEVMGQPGDRKVLP